MEAVKAVVMNEVENARVRPETLEKTTNSALERVAKKLRHEGEAGSLVAYTRMHHRHNRS